MPTVAKTTSQPATPGLSADTLMGAQRRYLEAWTTANQIMVDAMRTVIQRQTELAQSGMQDFLTGTGTMLQPGAGAPGAADPFGKMREFYEKAFSNFKELTEIMVKAQTEAMNVLSQCVTTNLDELKRTASRDQ